MIFITVGTHEQPFDRLVSEIDKLKRDGIIREEVLIQNGFSTYEPEYCQWSRFIPYAEMVKNVAEARIVITHGGPASFIMPLQTGKIPIVVPRKKQFGEHVNDHQVEFVKVVSEKYKNIIVVENVTQLGEIVQSYNTIIREMRKETESNNVKFNVGFAALVNDVMGSKVDEEMKIG